MSHAHERAEKICLNCNAALNGRFCHICGQENIEPKETVWGLISHFFYDITHFDGKFFKTARYLFTRPGFLPKEYIAGRRAAYLHPIRMYVFTSAVFFLVLFSVFKISPTERKRKNEQDLAEAQITALRSAKNREDSAQIEKLFAAITPKDNKKKKDSKDTTVVKTNSNVNVSFPGFSRSYSSRHEYDSTQKTLPANERHGWLKRYFNYRQIELEQRFHGDKKEMMQHVLETFMHTFPYLLFVSLPLYALFLKLLYLRRRTFYYVDHALFLLYLYIYTFLFLLVFIGLSKLEDIKGFGWLGIIEFIMLLWGIYYTYKAMRKFYGQGRGKTVVKFLLLNLLTSIVLLLLFSLFFIISYLRA